MAPSRKHSNGRSPLVNQQSQITAFFSKSSSSAATPSPKLSEPAPNPSSDPPSPGPATPSPVQTKSKKKPLFVIGGPTTHKPKTSSFGEEIVNKRVRVYWPLDKKWYVGRVASFHKLEGRHLVEYDDGEEEKLDLGKEKIELLEEEVQKKFKRLRKVSLVLEDNEEEEEGKEEHDEDDSEDEDWGEEKMEVEEECDDVVEWDEKEEVGVGKRKRTSGGMKATGSSKKSKTKCSSDNVRGGTKAKVDGNGSKSVQQKSITTEIVCTGDKSFQGFDDAMVGDTSERFRMRETEKFRFLGKERRDANRRCPGDVDYDPKTLYLPPDFLKSLSCGQRQWWEFKSKHMDKVLFFKMGKFYELFEMDAHIGAKDLDLQYMRGEQPHCGFPEKNFSMNVEKLARKGYRVLVVEQTETPEQLELRRKEKGSKDKVVKREICAVVTKGTLTEGELQSANPDASYLLAVTENCHISENTKADRIFGVCVVDVATSRIILGQFEDDSECNGLSCLLSELRPVEIIKPAGLLNPETERVILRHTRNPLFNELVPLMEFWDAERTVCEINSIYARINDLSLSGSLIEESFKRPNSDVKNGFGCLPDILSNLMSAGESGTYALSALGGTLSYLKQAFLDETLLRYAKFEQLPSSGFCNISQKPYMVLDAAALENLEIFENSRNGDSSGTLYAQLNHCVTSFGKRLLKTWLARPLYHANSIRERQDAVAGLRGVNLPFSLNFRKKLARLPDMERLLSRLFSSSDANGRHANKVVLYEDAAKKKLQEFISALRGCELMTEACSSLDSSLENVESSLLLHLLTVGRGRPDISSVIKHFRDAFDWVEANNSGRVIPHDGVDIEYDSACKIINEIDSNLKEHLKDQRKLLGESSINYVTIGKDEYLLEIPEWLRGKVPGDYELRSSKKGYFRYWNPSIKKLLDELSQAESEKESKLKSILQRLIRKFCEYHNELRQLVSTTAELDVLISLAIASDYYDGPSCRPAISGVSSPNEVPFLEAKNLGHPVLRSDSLSNRSFVPNDVKLGGVGQSSFILLTGPNMGGKSTLLRQVCLSIILAQIGADVPANSFELSPVDRIFVRMGAQDHIMAGQSTFLTELSETASMLSSATRNSLVALDELGRGTSTSDGQAIAESVLEYFVHKVQCRGMFSTHYHRLAVDYQKDPKVFLCHMGCQINGGDGGVEEVTFLYRIMPGACPKSYGVNVARLAGLPDSVLQKAAAKSLEFESMYGKNSESKSKQDTENEMGTFVQKVMEVVATLGRCGTIDSTGINTLTELQHGAKVLLLES